MDVIDGSPCIQIYAHPALSSVASPWTPPQKIGAAYQCRSSRVCPDIVLYQDFDQHMSSTWPEYVLVQFMSSICPPNQTFVLIKSRLCPHSPTFVLFLSSHQALINWKPLGQILVKFWKCLHFNLPSRNSASGQKLDNVCTCRSPPTESKYG